MGSRADGYSLDRRAFLQALGLGSGLAALSGACWTPEAQAAAAAGDVQFLPAVIHCHSRYSDGRLTPEELAAEVSSRGARVLVITDHYEDIPLDSGQWWRKNTANVGALQSSIGAVTAWTDRLAGFGYYYEDCWTASVVHGVVVVPGIEVDLGEPCDPFEEPDTSFLQLQGKRKVHMLGIGHIYPEVYDYILRVILHGEALVSAETRPKLPLSQLVLETPTKDRHISEGQLLAAKTLYDKDLATVIAHPWKKAGLGLGRSTDLYTFFRGRAEHVHAVEFFNGDGDDSDCLAALNIVNEGGAIEADPGLPSHYAAKFSVTAGSDYHYSHPKKVGDLDRVTWLGFSRGSYVAQWAANDLRPQESWQTACLEVADAIKGRLTVAGIGDAGSMTCAEWLAKTCGGWAEEFGDTFGAQPAGSTRTGALRFYAVGEARGSEPRPYIAHAWGKCVVAGVYGGAQPDGHERAKRRKATGVIIVIDRSRSVASCREDMEQGATTVADLALEAAGRVAVVNFADQGMGAVDAALTGDRGAIVSAIRTPSITTGGTALYDAIIGAVRHAERAGVRAVLAVLTDGEENSSSADLRKAIREASRRDFPIVMCGYGSRNDAVLSQLSTQTGGACFLYGVHGDIKTFFSEFVEFSESSARVHDLTGGAVSP